MMDRPLTEETELLANLGKRYRGQIVDGFIGVAGFIIGSLIVDALVPSLSKVIIWTAGIFYLLYILLADGLRGGQSYGKRVLKIAVVDAKTGAPCTFLQSAIRNACYILGPIDYLFIFGASRQRLGDRLAGTVVIDIADL